MFGQPALGVALSRGVKVSLRRGTGRVSLRLAEGLRGPAPGARATPESLVKAALGSGAADVDVELDLELPPSAGLGTSAAIAVALLRAKQTLLGEKPGTDLLRAAIAIEDLAHGRSSGLDPAICLAGGVVEFVRPVTHEGKRRRPKVRPLVPASSFHLVVGVHGTHGGTEGRIRGVLALREELPQPVDRAIATLGSLTRAGTRALVRGELEIAGQAMNLAHGILSGFGLVSGEVEQMVRLARASGALGGKMSGAGGGGGAFFALAPDVQVAHRIREALERAGAQAWLETAG